MENRSELDIFAVLALCLQRDEQLLFLEINKVVSC